MRYLLELFSYFFHIFLNNPPTVFLYPTVSEIKIYNISYRSSNFMHIKLIPEDNKTF